MKNTCHVSMPRQETNATWLVWVCDAPLNKFRGSINTFSKFTDLYDTRVRVEDRWCI